MSEPPPIPSIRLACQLRPQSDISVIPILPPYVGADFVRNRRRINVGEERYLVSMFVDMRGSTTLVGGTVALRYRVPDQPLRRRRLARHYRSRRPAEQFRRRRHSRAVRAKSDPADACREALRAAALVASNIAHLNHQFATEVREPIQYGIGIHAGEVIIGDVGFRGNTVFTALGDFVNVTARLQELSKTLDCRVVVSDEVCKLAGLPTTRSRARRSRSAARSSP